MTESGRAGRAVDRAGRAVARIGCAIDRASRQLPPPLRGAWQVLAGRPHGTLGEASFVALGIAYDVEFVDDHGAELPMHVDRFVRDFDVDADADRVSLWGPSLSRRELATVRGADAVVYADGFRAAPLDWHPEHGILPLNLDGSMDPLRAYPYTPSSVPEVRTAVEPDGTAEVAADGETVRVRPDAEDVLELPERVVDLEGNATDDRPSTRRARLRPEVRVVNAGASTLVGRQP